MRDFKGEIAEERRVKVLDMRAKGFEYFVICERLGISKGCIAAIVQKENLRLQREEGIG